jgi:general secretion pathway protein G
MKKYGDANGGKNWIIAGIVISIVGTVWMPVCGLLLMGDHNAQKLIATQLRIEAYSVAINQFESDTGFRPTTAQGLAVLIDPPPDMKRWKGPYLDPPVVRPDAWGHPFVYRNPGLHNTNTFEIYSAGPDGILDTADDITSWK